MASFECAQCGYLTATIDFRSCPGCGGDAGLTYVPVPDAGTTYGDGEVRYRGLFLEFPEPSGEGFSASAPDGLILFLAGSADHRLRIPVERWYRSLSAVARRRGEEKVALLFRTLTHGAMSVLTLRERDVLFRKVLEVVAHGLGVARRKASCLNCTYSLGEAGCDIADILEQRGIGGPSPGGSLREKVCVLFVQQMDIDHVERRLRACR